MSMKSRRKRRKGPSIKVAALIGAGILVCICLSGIFLYRQSKEDEVSAEQMAEAEKAEEQSVQKQDAVQEEMPSEEELLQAKISEMLTDMTLEEKAAQMFMITPEALTGTGQVLEAGDGEEALDILINYEKMLSGEAYDETMLKDLVVYEDIGKQPNRKRCAYLPFESLRKVLQKM